MGSRKDIDDDDDDFSELYKAYTGPIGTKVGESQEKTTSNKRSLAGSDDEEKEKDPYAVPTDFTSREAKFWEAKSKANEKNWKKKKEEEMICKLCGESGHFTQGCPTTLGANRKSQDFFERVPAREPHVKALFTEQVVNQLEKDIGCKIKIEEKFIIVSGKDRLVLKKGVDAVHKMKEDGEIKGPGHSSKRSKSPLQRSPVRSRLEYFDYQRSNNSGPPPRFSRQGKAVEDHVRDPQAYGARGRSKSPTRNAHNEIRGRGYMMDSRGEMTSDRSRSNHSLVEEFAFEYQREATELGRLRDKEEEEERYKHREAMREIRETYVKKTAMLRGSHAREWEEFLQFDAQKRQQQARRYTEYENSSAPEHLYSQRDRYPMMENHPSSRPHDYYVEYQRQGREDYGKAYNRY